MNPKVARAVKVTIILVTAVTALIFSPHSAGAQQCPAPLGPCATCFTGILGSKWCGGLPVRVDYYYAASIPSGSAIISAVEWATGEWNFETLHGKQIPVWFDNQGGQNLSIQRFFLDGPGGTLAEMRHTEDALGHMSLATIVFDSGENWETMPVNEIRWVALHELGHALGLNHVACSIPPCPNLLMYPCQNGNPVIDGTARSSLQCIYGDLVESPCQSLFGRFIRAIVDQPDRLTLSKGTCRGCVSTCFDPQSGETPEERVGTISYELAISSNGGPYAVFATLNEGGWSNDTFVHQFSESWPRATVRMRVLDGANMVGEAYSYPPVDVVSTTDVADPRAPRLEAISVLPTPSRGRMRFALTVKESGRLQICDVAGRAIRTFAVTAGTARQTLDWDGKDDSGTDVQNGVYFVVLLAGVERRAVRAVVAR